jgi:Flp pilus assembly protein TadB
LSSNLLRSFVDKDEEEAQDGCKRERRTTMFAILWIIAAILVAFWIIGLVAHLLSWGIHVILVLAIILVIIGFLTRD